MSLPTKGPRLTIALPVYNGADTLGPAIQSVLDQTCSDIELVISDNASTDGTDEVCRKFAQVDERIVYQRHATNVGLLNNFRSAAESARGTYVRWLGDDDFLEPDYASRVLEVFAEDDRRVLVTTQIAYVDAVGVGAVHADYDPVALTSADPVERFGEMLRLLTGGFALLDPLYGTMRRELALLPRRNRLREDELFASRLALAGPWGHVPAPLATRRRSEAAAAELGRLLGVPSWHRGAVDLMQCQELLSWIGRSSLDPGQRGRACAEVLRLYARRKRNMWRRGVAKLQRTRGRSGLVSSSAARGPVEHSAQLRERRDPA